MNFFEFFDPTGGEYYDEKEKRKDVFERMLRGVKIPFHWQFTKNRSTLGTKYEGVIYNQEFLDVKTESFGFNKNSEESLRSVEFEWDKQVINCNNQQPVISLIRDIVKEINRRDEPEMVIFYDITCITEKIEGVNVSIDYAYT